jgi:hypothetical protein
MLHYKTVSHVTNGIGWNGSDFDLDLLTYFPLASIHYSPPIGEQLLDGERRSEEEEPAEAVAGTSREMNTPYNSACELWHDSVMRVLAAVSAKEDPASSPCPQICRESLRVRISAYSQAWLKCPNAGCAWVVPFGCEVGLSKETAIRKLIYHYMCDHTYLKEREENSSVGGQQDEKLKDVAFTEKEKSKWLKDVQKLLIQEEEDEPVRLSLLLSDLLDDVEGACNVAGAGENSGLKGLLIDVTAADAARVAGKEAVVGGLWELESGSSPSCRLHCAKYLLKEGEAQKIEDSGCD